MKLKERLKKALVLLSAAAMLVSVAACSGGEQSAAEDNVIKIGYINPTTGPIAGSGEGCEWIVKQFTDYVKENPITIDGKKMDFEVIVYDNESNANKCSEMAQKLIEEDNIDLMIAVQTPTTVIPAAEIAERYEVPCIVSQAPVDTVASVRDEYNWTYLSFYTFDEGYELYKSLFTTAGFAPGSGAKVGLLYANDADGTAWHEMLVKRFAEDGYTVIDPGQYPTGTADFTNVANKFKNDGVDVIVGSNISPDFVNCYNAIINAGVEVSAINMGKCCTLESDINALGDLGDNILITVWWSPSHPFSSALTGVSSSELAAKYLADNGRNMPQAAAFGYQAMELAIQALRNTKSMNKEDIRAAIAGLDVDTIVGHIKYDGKKGGLTYAATPLCGGQWQREDGKLVLKVIDNSLHPDIPKTGEYMSGNATTKK